MSKLNQVIAIEKGIKSRVYAEISELHKASQKPELFNGFTKEYRPKDDDGEGLPAEQKRVQYVASDVLRAVERGTTELMKVTARKDWTNNKATAGVVVDGRVIVAGAPVTYLLFLEKQINDLRTFVSSMPVLDEADEWKKDENSDLYRTDPVQTHRTKKLQRPIVLYDATDKHPAQTQLITEDVIAGFWHSAKISGAMPKPAKRALLDKLEKLTQAVKEAREAANNCDEVETPDVGGAIFGYLLG